MESFINENMDTITLSSVLLLAAYILMCILCNAYYSRKNAIKVIKKGDKKPEWFRVTCSHCGSVLEFSSDHVKKKDKSEPSSVAISNRAYIVCPVCGKEVEINYSI